MEGARVSRRVAPTKHVSRACASSTGRRRGRAARAAPRSYLRRVVGQLGGGDAVLVGLEHLEALPHRAALPHVREVGGHKALEGRHELRARGVI